MGGPRGRVDQHAVHSISLYLTRSRRTADQILMKSDKEKLIFQNKYNFCTIHKMTNLNTFM